MFQRMVECWSCWLTRSASAWRDFYLDHDKRLLSKIYGFAIPSSLTTRRDGGRDVAECVLSCLD